MNPVTYAAEDDLAIVTIDHPPVNAMSLSVRDGLAQAIEAATADGMHQGIVRCNGRTFVAGGDISEFGHPPQEPHLPDVYQHLEDSPITWLAAMHGTVLGGGFELAMACDFRIATANTRFGLPEVTLGLVPGAGGTQRLPRLLGKDIKGMELAIDLCCSGRMISASELLEAGGLDAIVSQSLDNEAKAFFESPTAENAPVAVSKRSMASVPADFFSTQKEKVLKAARGATAPLDNLEAIEWATRTDFAQGQPLERQRHLTLRNSDQSVALRHAFFAQRSVAKPAAIKDATARSFHTIAIVGGGLMGSGIATSSLLAGLEVRMIEVNPDTGLQNVDKLLQGAAKRGKLDNDSYQSALSRFTCSDDYRIAAECDIAIEAVFEDLSVKQQVFAKLAQHMGDDAIIATNTSYLNPLDIAQSIDNPARIVGLHFFSPAHVMKLLEIVRTPNTSADVLATSFALAKKLKKTGVLAGICDGFIGNRMLAAYRRQADYLLADGAYPEQIDSAMRSYGMPMGPYELQDLTGLQIGYANRKRLAPARDPSERYIPIADQLCELERFGQRSGAGWYLYEEGSRKPVTDPKVNDLINRYSELQGITRKSFDDSDIQQRMIAILANEGERILEEKIAERALDIDMVKIHGYGFPRWRGGPMHAASQAGDSSIKEALHRVTTQSPGSWTLAKKYL